MKTILIISLFLLTALKSFGQTTGATLPDDSVRISLQTANNIHRRLTDCDLIEEQAKAYLRALTEKQMEAFALRQTIILQDSTISDQGRIIQMKSGVFQSPGFWAGAGVIAYVLIKFLFTSAL